MHYWLLKSEPATFGIEQLKPGKSEPWDGVRNYQARNMLRDEMKVNDLAFFYHSSCAEPGIVGIVKIVNSGYPDASAWNNHSPYFDPQSTQEKPRWFCVDVMLIERFKHRVSLVTLRQQVLLKDMRLLQKGNRLSVMPIKANEWRIIVALAKR